MAYTYNQEWAEPLTQQEQVVLSIGLLISDNFAVPWQDGVSFFKTAAGAGTVVQAQISEDLPMYSLSDFIRVGIGLVFAESLTLIDTVFYVHAQVTAGGNTGSRIAIGDNGSPKLVEAVTSVLQLNLPLSDNLNYWLDQPAPFFSYEFDLVITCAEEGANWLDASTNVIGLTEVLSDTMTLSDVLTIGRGNLVTDQLTQTDAIVIGLGDLIAESISLSDSIIAGCGNQLVDSLTLTDFVVIGYGDLVSDTITLVDVFVILDQGGSFSYELFVGPIVIGTNTVGLESLSLSEAVVAGYGLLVTDQMTLSDVVVTFLAGSIISEVLSDSLTLSDQLRIGYGDVINDQIVLSDVSPTIVGEYDLVLTCPHLNNWSDDFSQALSLVQALTDSLSLSDSLVVGYGDGLADQFTVSDAIRIGYGFQIIEQLVQLDLLLLGYGDLVTDTLSISDSLAISLTGSALSATLTDSLSLSEKILLEYGDRITDQIVLSDVSPTVIGEYDLVLTCPHLGQNWSDGLAKTLTTGGVFKIFSEQLTLSEQLRLGYGFQILDQLESNTQLAQDTFNRLNENPLDPVNWTQVSGQGALQVVNNDCLPTALTGSAANYTGITWPDGQYVDVVLAFAALGEFDVVMRSDAGQTNCYRFGFIDNGNNTADVFIKVIVAGVPTTLFENLALPFNLNDTFRAAAFGANLSFYQNGVLFGSVNDSTYPSGMVGLFLAGIAAITDIQIANFSGGLITTLLSDKIAGFGYGDVVTDQLLWSDQFSFALGGTQFGEFLTDILSLSDQFSFATNSFTLSDSLTLAEQSNLTVGLNISPVESISLTDQLSSVMEMDSALVDSLSITDKASVGYGNQIADQMTMADFDAIVLGIGIQVVDQETFSDQITFAVGGASQVESLSDILSLSDQFSFAINSLIFSDTMLVSDQFSFAMGEPSVFIDTLVLSDQLGLEYDFLISDSLTLSEQSNLTIGQNINAVDSFSLSDQIRSAIGLSISDALTLSDQLGFSVGGSAATEVLSDMLSLSDSLLIGIGNRITDSLTLTDNLTSLFSSTFITKAFSDSLPLFDVFGFAFSGPAMAEFLADVMSLSEQVDIIIFMTQFGDLLVQSERIDIGFGSRVADQITLSDAFVKNAIATRQLVDTLTMSDQLGLEYDFLISDSLTLLDQLLLEYDLLLTDQLVLTEQVTTNLIGGALSESLTDQLSLSDQLGIGYGLLISDQLSMTDFVALGTPVITEQLSDTLVLVEQLVLGYGDLIADALTVSDVAAIGYGDGLSDTLTLSDVVALGYGNVISDSLTMADAFADILIVVSESLSDSLVLSEQLRIGFGDLITDQLTLSESIAFLFPLSSTFTEQFTLTDQNSLGYGFIISDSLTLSDVLNPLGFGDLISDSLTLTENLTFQLLGALISIFPSDLLSMSDGLGLGYGDQIADQVVLSEQVGVGYGNRVADQVTLTDQFAFSYVLFQTLTDTITLSDALVNQVSLAFGFTDTLTMVDVLSTIGIGNQIAEQMVLTEGPVLGFGIILNDQMAAQTDGIGAGYGNAVSDQTAAQADQIALTEALLVQIADATPAQLDAITQLFAGALAFSDALVLQEQLTVMYGIIVAGDSIALADQLNPMLITPLALALSDPTVAAWLDGILMTVIFAPSTVVLRTLAVIPEVVITDLTVTKAGG